MGYVSQPLAFIWSLASEKEQRPEHFLIRRGCFAFHGGSSVDHRGYKLKINGVSVQWKESGGSKVYHPKVGFSNSSPRISITGFIVLKISIVTSSDANWPIV